MSTCICSSEGEYSHTRRAKIFGGARRKSYHKTMHLNRRPITTLSNKGLWITYTKRSYLHTHNPQQSTLLKSFPSPLPFCSQGGSLRRCLLSNDCWTFWFETRMRRKRNYHPQSTTERRDYSRLIQKQQWNLLYSSHRKILITFDGSMLHGLLP